MKGVFDKLDKIKPVYDVVYNITMLICKLLLIADILITSYAVLGRYVHKYIPFITDPSWSEEIVLTCMAYMAVLSAALAIRRGAHIRMTAFDRFLPEKLLAVLDILADIAVLCLGVVMLVEGWKYAINIGAKGFYISLPNLSKFWMYFPVPVAGFVMIVFQIESLYNTVKKLCLKEDDQRR